MRGDVRSTPVRPVTVLIAALGGEGGGVLADWLIDAATALGFPVQSTSVPGVAQRTGATTYYVEIFPVPQSSLQGRSPVLSLTPSPGQVDVVAASELIEAGRVVQRGYVHPRRTTLVASTHREYAVSEKAAMGDGRYDEAQVLRVVHERAQQAVLFDMRALAQRHGTVINTVMFGAMVGAGALPLPREACEAAIRRSGKAVEASLRGFAAGIEAAQGGVPAAPVPVVRGTAAPARVLALPGPVHAMAALGVAQTTDYQDAAYAGLYLDRVERLAAVEREVGADGSVTREAARYLALWMCYEDVIRVADLKTRRDRLARVRREVGAKSGEPLQLTEFLKPGLDEACSVLPPSWAAALRRRLGHRAERLHVGLHVRTHTVTGFALLCLLRSLRRWRRRTARYATEQALIVRWLATVEQALRVEPALALELALCGNLVKGYGETSARGHRNLTAILEDVQPIGAHPPGVAAGRVKAARQAALADPEGRKLAGALGRPTPEPKVQPIHIVRRRPIG